MKIKSFCISFFLLISVIPLGAIGKLERTPSSFSKIPQEQNKKAILECLNKLNGLMTADDSSSLDLLKTKIETVYNFKKSEVTYRELMFKNSKDERWKIEFYLALPEKNKSKERYKLKYLLENKKGEFELSEGAKVDEITGRSALIEFAQFENVEQDIRWERFIDSNDPSFSYKSKGFKIFELEFQWSFQRKRLFCSIAGSHPFCQCSN